MRPTIYVKTQYKYTMSYFRSYAFWHIQLWKFKCDSTCVWVLKRFPTADILARNVACTIYEMFSLVVIIIVLKVSRLTPIINTYILIRYLSHFLTTFATDLSTAIKYHLSIGLSKFCFRSIECTSNCFSKKFELL